MKLKETISRFSKQIRVASEEKRYTDTIKILDELRAELRAAPPEEGEVLELLNEIYTSKSASDSQYGFIAAWSNLSSAYVPLLCDMVSSEECNNIHEPAVELLSELADARAFDALKKAISYRWAYDQWFHVPRKALQGLSRIGGDEAYEIIKRATDSNEKEIRSEAVEILQGVDS